MIRYSLKCADGHTFESWFQSASAFDALAGKGLVTCAACGISQVDKALMAPKVAGAATPAALTVTGPSEIERKIKALRDKVEKTATYVGGRFAAEARAIHEGDKPDRPIWGEADAAQVKGLLADGVPVAPLPFLPKSKAN